MSLAAAGQDDEALTAVQEAAGALADAETGEEWAERARVLQNLSVRLAAGGHHAEAVEAIEEAVRIRRALARAEPGRFRPDLAAALHNMSADLAASGQDGRALDAITEAVAIRRELAARSHVHARDLASSLRILSIRLAADGRPAEAADAAGESASIFRSLTARKPDRFRPELAMSLSTLSSRLGTVGRHHEALAVAEECVGLRRILAAAAPDAYLPELAISLNNLSVSLARAGQPQKALAAAEETVRIRRDLAAAHPELYTADLATSLNTFGVDLGDAGRHPEALTALHEAVWLLRPLAASDPRAALPDLVMSLNNLCEQFAAMGRHAEAEEQVARLRTEYKDNSWATGIILLGQGQWSAEDDNIAAAITDARDALDLLEADAPAQAEAHRFLRRLRRQDPGQFDLAWDDARGGQAPWLRYLDGDRHLADEIDRWVTAPALEEEEALLAADPRLVSEEAEAVLDHLIDDNPGNRWLHMHRDILREARIGGVEDAYARHRRLLWREGTAKALATWFGAAREDLRDVLAEERCCC
ncbi:MAG TPA: tetratricopeptide repeat protein [Streptosporangiaceae bacterium]|nr:tetratricopeptide repeat protein [Streptosporangiaceae bacterium]